MFLQCVGISLALVRVDCFIVRRYAGARRVEKYIIGSEIPIERMDNIAYFVRKRN